MFATILLLLPLISAFNPEVHNKFETLPRHEFIEYFNSMNFSWKITHHEDTENTILPSGDLFSGDEYPTQEHEFKETEFPKNFDARIKWPKCSTIKEIYHQGECGSCWTFGSTTTASDRICIHTGENVSLSPQDLSCCKNCFNGSVCTGGYTDRALKFWVEHGIVSNLCRPYNIEELRNGNACRNKCINEKNYNNDKHKGSKVYKIKNDEEQIKAELFKNGPIAASFLVYVDFFNYTSGIYEHTYGAETDHHSVRIIGYGEESGVPYWLVANSWGKQWGDNGFFKCKRGQIDLGMEAKLITGLPISKI